jgi:diacylglycerol kinase (ATP)
LYTTSSSLWYEKKVKNRPFKDRLKFAWNGVFWAWTHEASFRFQVVSALGMIFFTGAAGATPFWWALILLTIGGVLSLELVNTALEALLDRVHPEIHPLIQIAKDCAAGAVLLQSLVSLLVFVFFVFQKISA